MKIGNAPGILLFTIIILLTPVFTAIAQDPSEILRRAEDNMRGDASYTEMTMQTVRPRFTREVTMRAWLPRG